jgi:hypothetical protein
LVSFASSKTFIDLNILGCTHTQTETKLRYQSDASLSVGEKGYYVSAD